MHGLGMRVGETSGRWCVLSAARARSTVVVAVARQGNAGPVGGGMVQQQGVPGTRSSRWFAVAADGEVLGRANLRRCRRAQIAGVLVKVAGIGEEARGGSTVKNLPR